MELPENTFVPTERQRHIWELVASCAKPGAVTLLGYGGAAGGGKTRMLVEMAIDLALNYPGNRILIGRKDFNDLSSTVMESFFRYVPRKLVAGVNNNQHWVKLRLASWPAGVVSTIRFRELKDWTGLGSEEYGAVLIDEAGEVGTDSVLMLLSRLRWTLPAEVQNADRMSYFFIAASNPFPGWFKDWFVDGKLSDEVKRMPQVSVHFIPAKASDNPHLPPHYETFLRAVYPASWVKRLMDGDWDVYIGQVYPQFDPSIHEWRKTSADGQTLIPAFTRIIGGIDFGHPSMAAHKTAAIVAGITPGNRLIRLACFEEAGPDVYERLVRWMSEQERRWTQYIVRDREQRRFKVFAESEDPRITWCADRSQIGWIQEMRHSFVVVPSQGGRGSVKWGIGLVSNRLNVDESGNPGSYYMPWMQNFADAMRRYMWPEINEGEPAPSTPLKVNDDLVDADRYMHEVAEKYMGDPQPLAASIPRHMERPYGEEQSAILAGIFGTTTTRKTEDVGVSVILEPDAISTLKVF